MTTNTKYTPVRKMKYRCEECMLPTDIPFDNGDGIRRCEGCAIDKYQQSAWAGVRLKREYCTSVTVIRTP